MSEPTSSIAFLPWVRRGAAVNISRDEASAALEPRASVDVRIDVASAGSAELKAELFGPEDVAGLSRSAILRVSPGEDALQAKANDFPFVEFSEADLPWRYSPARPDSANRLSPWLRLVVLRENEVGTFDPLTAGRKCGRLEVLAPASLPPAEQAWAWGHVQATGVGSAALDAEVVDILKQSPDRFVARLLCPRWLEANTSYLAFVVPVFERGRRAGLGEPLEQQLPFEYAWSASTARPLPVYFHWRFRTGPAGDFETLASRIKANTTSDFTKLGGRGMDVSDPGMYLPAPHDSAMLVEGALKSPGAVSTDWSGVAHDVFVPALTSLLDEPLEAEQTPNPAPRVAPPKYGQWQAAHRALSTAGPSRPWLRELNLDPRHRVAAGLGTQVVQAQQRQLLASAWEQLGGLRRVNEALRFAQLSREASSHIFEASLTEAGDDAFFWLTAPLHGRVLGAEGSTIRNEIKGTAIDVGVLDPQWRKLSRPRGALGRRQGRLSGPTSTLLTRMVTPVVQGQPPLRAALPPPARTDMSTPIGWAQYIGTQQNSAFTLGGFAAQQYDNPIWVTLFYALWALRFGVNTDALYDAPPWNSFLSEVRDNQWELVDARGYITDVISFQIPGRPDFEPVEIEDFGDVGRSPDPVGGSEDSEGAAAFRQAALKLLDRLDFAPQTAPAPKQVDLAILRGPLQQAINPRLTVAEGLLARLRLASRVMRPPGDNLEPVMAHPEFPQPMYRALAELSLEWLLPGVSDIPEDSATVLVPNQKFIEAFMVGLSHEMGRELLWHEYPTDQRGTYFRQFWDPSARTTDATTDETESLRDITPIDAWGDTSLGGHRPPLPSGTGQLVLLIRGELLRRFPGTTVYLVRADASTGPSGTEPVRHPIFGATLPPDMRFFGFDLSVTEATTETSGSCWFFVLEEAASELHFGLDDSGNQSPPALADWDSLSWQHLGIARGAHVTLGAPALNPTDPGGAKWNPADGATAADLPVITMQKPVRVAIPVSKLLAIQTSPSP